MKGRKPSKAEQEWLSKICDLGCIVCLMEGHGYSPAMPHHLIGKTAIGAHFETIPLCHAHHQGGYDNEECVSRHPYKARFEARYGTESELLQETIRRLNEG